MERLLKTPEGDKPHPDNLKDGWLDEDQDMSLDISGVWCFVPLCNICIWRVLHNFTCFLEIAQKQHFHSVSGKIL